MSAAVCLTLAAVHALVWLRARDARSNLLFAIAAIAAAVLAILEVNLMHAQSPLAYAEMLRWMHVSAAVLVIALVWFLRFFLNAGRHWLAWTITGLRVLVLVPNFLFYPNATFAEVVNLRHVEFLGDVFSAPVGTMNPWRVLIHISMVLFAAYVLDAAVSAWKQGHRRRALTLGGTTSLAIALAAIFSDMMTRGILPGPFITMVFFLIVLAMAFELSVDLIRARQLATQLGLSEARMRLAASAANLGIWEWDVVRDRVWVNESGRAPVGVGESDLMTLDQYLQLIHPDDRGLAQRAVERAVQGDGPMAAEFRIVQPNGETRWLSVYGQVEHGKNGKPLHMRGISTDISARKRSEAALQNQRKELAHVQRVAAMGQLSSALAHELSQPLAAILRNAEAADLYLRKDPPDLDELRAIVVDIRNDEERAASVIERMRLLLKRRELHREALALGELIGQVGKLLRIEVDERHATLKVEVSPDLPEVWGDRVQLQQVILNLVLNSLDALEGQSTGRKAVTIRAVETAGGMIEVKVIDQGIGIAPEQLPHVFEPFVTTKSKGMGMGLAISKQIIELHGGNITIENNPDGGATVCLTLKVARSGEMA